MAFTAYTYTYICKNSNSNISAERIPRIRNSSLTHCTSVPEEDEEEYHDNDNQKGESVTTIKDLTERLETLQKLNDLLTKRGTMLQRALNELESLETISPELSAKIKAVNEKATQFRIAANAMVKVCIYLYIQSICLCLLCFLIVIFVLRGLERGVCRVYASVVERRVE